MRAFLAAGLLSAALAGCAVGPDRAIPAPDVPARWTKGAEGAATDLTAWWERFGDPALDGIVGDTLRGNVDVATAMAKVREARALSGVAESALYPSLGGTAAATGSRNAAGGGAAAGSSSLYGSGFDQSWELDLFGGNHRAAEAARYDVEADVEGLRSARLTAVADAVRYYVDARGYQARLALARKAAEAQRQTAALTDRMLAAGAGSGADAAKARAQALSTEANIPALEAGLATSADRLAVLAGSSPQAMRARLAAPRPVPVPRAAVAAGIPAAVVRARPDVRRAEATFASATALVGQAQARLYPDVSMGGTLGLSAGGLGSLLSGSAVAYSLGPSLTLPLLDAGGRRAAVTAQEAVRDQRLLALRGAVLDALRDVEDSLVAVSTQRIQAVRLDASAAAYAEADRIAHALFAQGSTAFLDVLDADRSLYGAQDAAAQARVSLAEDYAALFKALGGGWPGLPGAGVPLVPRDGSGPRPRAGTTAG